MKSKFLGGSKSLLILPGKCSPETFLRKCSSKGPNICRETFFATNFASAKIRISREFSLCGSSSLNPWVQKFYHIVKCKSQSFLQVLQKQISENHRVRKSLMSVMLLPATLGLEMAAPILWALGIFRFLLLEKPHAHKIPPFGGGGVGVAWKGLGEERK